MHSDQYTHACAVDHANNMAHSVTPALPKAVGTLTVFRFVAFVVCIGGGILFASTIIYNTTIQILFVFLAGSETVDQ